MAGLKTALCACLSILSVAATATAASAQAPGGPPGAPAQGSLPRMRGPELTEAQKMITALPPPEPGVVSPPGDPGPAMPGQDPRDLKGTWYHIQPLVLRNTVDQYGFTPPYSMQGAKILHRRVVSHNNGKPYLNASALCLPAGPFWQLDLNMPFSIFESSKGLNFVFMEYHGRWRIAYDAKDAPVYPENDKPYQGNSVGHWEGDTLVVETTGFRQDMWLDAYGTPLSKNAKIVQRIHKVDNGDGKPFLEIAATFFDPAYYTQPWSLMRKFSWQPNRALLTGNEVLGDYNCEEQVGDPSVSPDAGLPSEAQEDAQLAAGQPVTKGKKP